jgi:hypothetical protein
MFAFAAEPTKSRMGLTETANCETFNISLATAGSSLLCTRAPIASSLLKRALSLGNKGGNKGKLTKRLTLFHYSMTTLCSGDM